ncbi:MAG: DUF1329 domain-containing protein [Desulfobacteraceae bacterium]|nr:DUF1329 domain-containing protein [Desulfobacteraceae bacterium]MBC2755809.1 DUF1329 domain-containing protein [Desulfobacteraceae bacterium]
MRKIILITFVCFFAIGFVVPNTWAKLSPEEIARLGKDLTPLGAEKAANADGTIPAWEGGITTPPSGYEPGMHHPDPFAGDKVLFSIDSANMDQYADKLTQGHKAMLKAMDTYKMNVYPTRRSASVPQRIYDATIKNAATAELVEGGNGVTGSVIGTPFPIPKNGLEVIWNSLLKYKGDSLDRTYAKFPVTRGGSYEKGLVHAMELFLYHREGATEEKLNNLIFVRLTDTLGPPRNAGKATIVHETLDQAKEARKAWSYKPGQRRVLRAPEIGFDNPNEGSDGIIVTDQIDIYNGSPQRYDWNLVGKKEMVVPYNSYKLHSGDLKYKDILQKRHINPELARYELHRVWVVDATLKQGTRHIYKRRTFYIDEDSWQILAVDCYDNRDQLWKLQEAPVVNYYDVPTLMPTFELTYDFQSGRYNVFGVHNEEDEYVFNKKMSPKLFTPAALRRMGIR